MEDRIGGVSLQDHCLPVGGIHFWRSFLMLCLYTEQSPSSGKDGVCSVLTGLEDLPCNSVVPWPIEAWRMLAESGQREHSVLFPSARSESWGLHCQTGCIKTKYAGNDQEISFCIKMLILFLNFLRLKPKYLTVRFQLFK